MTHDCDLCGATEQLPLPGDPSGKIGICRGCGFVYVAERRSIEEVAHAWTAIYRDGGYDPTWPGVKARLFYVAEWLDVQVGLAGKSVLDIGSGNGCFLDFARRHGAITTGLDPDSANVAEIKPFHYAVQGYASDDAMAIDQFDIVTLNWTLENTADCMAVLRYAKRSLKPDGLLVVATGSRVGVTFKKPFKSYIPQDPNYSHDTHCYRWSVCSIGRALNGAGFETAISNDFMDRDEMIMIGRHGKHNGWNWEKAEEIHDYFAAWKRLFP